MTLMKPCSGSRRPAHLCDPEHHVCLVLVALFTQLPVAHHALAAVGPPYGYAVTELTSLETCRGGMSVPQGAARSDAALVGRRLG